MFKNLIKLCICGKVDRDVRREKSKQDKPTNKIIFSDIKIGNHITVAIHEKISNNLVIVMCRIKVTKLINTGRISLQFVYFTRCL